jgi:HlyD family secretion protein
VRVAVDGQVHERTLRLGLRTLAAAEVLDGLQAGEAVLTGGKFKDGQRVTVVPVGWPAGSAAAPGARREDGAGAAGSAITNAMGR